MAMAEAQESTYTIVIVGADATGSSILFEPGAGEFQIEPGQQLKVVISGLESERLEITHGAGYVTLWPSPKLSLAAYDDAGKRLRLIGY
jgi:hypothetical protein